VAAENCSLLQGAGIPDDDGSLLGGSGERRAVRRENDVDQPILGS
jgi:hypothetical protein